jgi:hypothetical protein
VKFGACDGTHLNHHVPLGRRGRSQPSSRTYLSSRIVVEEHARLNPQPASNTRDVVDRDVALRPLDPAEVSTIDAALVGQRFLAQSTLRPKTAHIPRQNVPQRSLVSLFHKDDFGSLTLLRRPLLSYIRSRYLQIADAPALVLERLEKFADTAAVNGAKRWRYCPALAVVRGCE